MSNITQMGLDANFDIRLRHIFQSLVTNPVLEQQSPAEEFETVRAAIRIFVLSAIASEAALSQIAQHSYRHDNGFIKLVLTQTSSEVSEVRLHIWTSLAPSDNSHQALPSNIHSHSTDFVSLVLSGGLIEETFEEQLHSPLGVKPSDPMIKYLCSSRAGQEHYEMHRVGEQSLSRTLCTELLPTTLHGLRYDVLHRIEPSRNATVTLFFQSERRSSGTSVYSDPRRPWLPVISSPHLQPQEVQQSLEWLIEQGIV